MPNKPVIVSENIALLTIDEVDSLFKNNRCGTMIAEKSDEIEEGDILKVFTKDPKDPFLWVRIEMVHKTQDPFVFLSLVPTYEPRDFSIDTCTRL